MGINHIASDVDASFKEPNASLRGFFAIFGGQSISLIGSNLVQFALVWWLTGVSGSAGVLALASIIALLPQVVLGPFSGVFVDRWNRRLVMLVADALIATATMALIVLYAFNQVQIWHIYVLMFVRSLAGAFHWAAMQASTSLMVPDEQLARVAGLNQSLNAFANIIAPPLGAILLAIMPIHNVLVIDIGTAMIAIIPLILIRIPQPPRSPEHEAEPLLSEMKAGIRFLWNWSALRIVTVIAMMINFLTYPAFSLLPIHVTNFFHGGALELAWLQSAYSIGLILGGITLSIWGENMKRVTTALTTLALSGLGLLLFGMTPAPILLLAIGAIFFTGVMNTIVNGTLMATLQAKVPLEKQGRIFSLIMSLSTAMAPLGLSLAGPIGDTFSVGVWYTAGGIVIMLAAVTSFSITSIRHNLLQLEEHVTPYSGADPITLAH